MLGIDEKAARHTWSAAAVLLLLLTIYVIRGTLIVFVIALLLAYLLYPLMDLIDRRLTARTRAPALALTFLFVIGVVGGFGAVIGSAVAVQADNLAKAGPALLQRIRQEPSTSVRPVKSIKDQIAVAIEGQVKQHYDQIVSFIPRASLQLLSISANLIYIVIIPILSFFILKDGRQIRDSFIDMLDSGSREKAEDTLLDVHTLLLQYMRALLFLCLATLVSFSIGLSLLGVPYSLLLASIAFPLEFVPLVGPLSAAAVIIAVTAFSGYPHVLWVVLFLGIYRIFQDYLLSPHLMSKGVELHPLLVIFGVFAGGEIGGVAGIFLSVPTLALMRLLYHRFRKSRVTLRQPVTIA
ncbi:MAG: AI-2E family transporter [Terriglobia bacterium]